MPHLREETLNSHLALLLDRHEGISATAESRSGTGAIDITVVHGSALAPVPIFIEANIGDTSANRRQTARQARFAAWRTAAVTGVRALLSAAPAGRLGVRAGDAGCAFRIDDRIRPGEDGLETK